jgi:acyl-CoA synthetase (NDP forming)
MLEEKKITIDTDMDFDPLFHPNSVVLMGLSREELSVSANVLLNIQSEGFPGKILVCNRRAAEGEKIFGLKNYPKLEHISEKEDIDLVVLMVPPDVLVSAMEECTSNNVKAAICITAGFGEAGKEGELKQKELVKVARKGRVRFTGPNCNGIYSADAKLAALLAPIRPYPGKVAVVTQGGSPNVIMMSLAQQHKPLVGFSRCVNLGDSADIQPHEMIEYFGHDTSTDVIACYFEGLKEGKKFIEVAKRITPQKPILFYKGGVTEAGKRSVMSHVGALSGDVKTYQAALKQAGVIQVNNISDLVDVAAAFTSQPLPKGNKVGILTFGGGGGVMAVDELEKLGMQMPSISQDLINEMNQILPFYWSHHNPVDMTDGVRDLDVPSKCAEMVIKQPYVDILLLIGVGILESLGDVSENLPPMIKKMGEKLKTMTAKKEAMMSKNLNQLKQKYGKPVVGCTIHAERDGVAIKAFHSDEIPVYDSPEKAARAVWALWRYKNFLNNH